MESTWFVVADRSQAHVYAIEGSRTRPTLRPIQVLEQPSARRAAEAASPASASSSHRMMVDPTGIQAEQDRRFVRELTRHLTQAQHRKAFSRLLIAAPADFVGHLRETAGRPLQRAVHREIIGDYTGDTVQALTERLRRQEWLD